MTFFSHSLQIFLKTVVFRYYNSARPEISIF